jgi:predicted esterase
VYALVLGLVESEYFASVAVHAAALLPGDYGYIDRAKRNIPMAIFAGDRDNVFPPSLVRSARDALQASAIPLKLVEIKNHGHDYYGPAESINREVWEFLKTSKLPNAPRYEFYFFFQLM